ncbi:protein Ecm3p [[Candida] jaroonii]|uniref:Protein Ecm3p n=1 Tax=[Candida] jaroonii TaxID=467808 RepID=A0ACA9YDC3_9ASCO|nr:protein Ecm3p [[Candida] jaroonii]
MSVDLGSVIYSAVKPIFKIYFIVALGFYLAKKNILTVSTCRDISDTIVTAILPCLVFENIVANLKSSDIKNLGIVFFTASLLFGTGLILAYIIFIVTRSPKKWLGGLLSVGLFPNISDLPIAYMQTLSNGGLVFSDAEGDKGVAYICIFLAAQALFQFSFGLYELISWDFRQELVDEENQIEKDLTNEDSESGSEKRDRRKNSNEITEDTDVDRISLPRITTPEDELSFDDDLSISSSLAGEVEAPPPTDIGQSSINGSPVRKLSTNRDSISQQLSRRVSRMRRNSVSSNPGQNILQPTRSRDLRTLKSQDMNDVINEYSEFDTLRTAEAQTVLSSAGEGMVLVKSVSAKSQHVPLKQKVKKRIISMLKNFISPVSFTLILSIAVAMSPPLKALFVKSTFHIPNAPDGQPPLSFVMDTVSYIGNASVPLGLILLGATIARLEIKSMPEGFWKTAVGITIARLVILPIIGVGITTGMYKGGWYGDDKLLRFVSVLEYGLPSATSLVYFTAFYTDPNSKTHVQMDCLAVALIFQYTALCITLPFLVSFTIKVSLGY